jgi:hypothetical protein
MTRWVMILFGAIDPLCINSVSFCNSCSASASFPMLTSTSARATA